MAARERVGYMSQSFSLYTELTVRQNLDLHARLFHLPAARARRRVDDLVERFGLGDYVDQLASDLPLGIRQRLSLAVAIVHQPELLILDEPTSGVDPLARDAFWELLIDLSRNQGVTIFVSTHFMNEAARCDRISLMDAGRVLATDTPQALVRARGAANLEEAFIDYPRRGGRRPRTRPSSTPPTIEHAPVSTAGTTVAVRFFSLRRMLAYTVRETLELMRDPIRLAFALGGTAFLMLLFGFGITTDVNSLTLRRPRPRQRYESRSLSRGAARLAVLRRAAAASRRGRPAGPPARAAKSTATVEIPPGFGRDIRRGRPTEVGAWVDGAMPFRAETIRGYLAGRAPAVPVGPARSGAAAGRPRRSPASPSASATTRTSTASTPWCRP